MIVFDWQGKSTPGSTIDWNEDLHGILEKTDILPNLKNNQNFEIDSKCPNSSMVPEVKKTDRKRQPAEQWHMGVLGSSRTRATAICSGHRSIQMPSVRARRYRSLSARRTAAFTSPKRLPRPELTAAKKYVAIADHINSYSSFQTYTTGERYETLTEAYSAYKKTGERQRRIHGV